MRHLSTTIILSLALISCSSDRTLPATEKNGQSSQTISSAQASSTMVETVDGDAPAAEGGVKTAASSQTGSLTVPERLSDTGILEIGDPKAPLILLSFLHQSCTHCANFFAESFPRLQSDYIDTGIVRYQVILVPFEKYPESETQTRGLLCAAKQGKGLPMHQLLFQKRAVDRASILLRSKELKLALTDFESCLDSESIAQLIRETQRTIQSMDITLVPTFVLSGEKFVGTPTYADLRGWMDEKREK